MSVVADIVLGNTISFRSKSVSDNNYYHGIVLGVNDHELAKTYADIYTYNSNVQSSDHDVPEVELQSFLIIKLIDKIDDTTKYIIPFSKDWINEESLVIHQTNNLAVINVYECNTSNGQDVINLLKANGFKARIVEYQ
jgi:hypothetical protein